MHAEVSQSATVLVDGSSRYGGSGGALCYCRRQQLVSDLDFLGGWNLWRDVRLVAGGQIDSNMRMDFLADALAFALYGLGIVLVGGTLLLDVSGIVRIVQRPKNRDGHKQARRDRFERVSGIVMVVIGLLMLLLGLLAVSDYL